MEKSISQFKNIVIKNFSRKEFTYHEWMVKYHLEIVERIALELCDLHPEADRSVVHVLVWFHDFGKPINEEGEREVTLQQGVQALWDCGFSQDFVEKVLHNWELMEKKSEIDLRTAPVEAQIISSADGASHFVGVFYSSYFGDGHSFSDTQKRLSEKIYKDWERKIVLPEVKKAFQERYAKVMELLGNFPDKFIK